MAAQIQALIDKSDSFEIVRDQIAGILDIEQRRQQELAAAAGKDPRRWELRVFTEVSSPWEGFRDLKDPEAGDSPADNTPIVSVSFQKTTFDPSASDVIRRQTGIGVFNIDCFAYGISRNAELGHVAGEVEATLASQRAARLVRNILMSSHYTNLGLLKTVGQRFPLSLQTLHLPPEIRARNPIAENVRVTQLELEVMFTETSPQYEGQPLETVGFTVKRSPDGRVLAVASFDLTTP